MPRRLGLVFEKARPCRFQRQRGPVRAPPDAHQPAGRTMAGARIVVVGDTPEAVEEIGQQLAAEGYDPRGCRAEAATAGSVRERHAALVITDLRWSRCLPACVCCSSCSRIPTPRAFRSGCGRQTVPRLTAAPPGSSTRGGDAADAGRDFSGDRPSFSLCGAATRAGRAHDALRERALDAGNRINHMPSQDTQLLRVKDIAGELNVRADAVRALCRTGVLPAFRVGTQWRVTREAFERWRAEQQTPASGASDVRQ